jgi:hypothetical protein
MRRKPTINTIGIQSGLVTHHQDQLATSPIPANFRNKNTRKIKVPNPIPFAVLLLSAILKSACYFFNDFLFFVS